jgi:hydrogenase expression/formation protein HypC
VLVFLDTAREIITAKHAAQIQDALQALTFTLQGDYNVDHLFADLVNREPQLPDFLCEK